MVDFIFRALVGWKLIFLDSFLTLAKETHVIYNQLIMVLPTPNMTHFVKTTSKLGYQNDSLE
jgi:hypothetical protein